MKNNKKQMYFDVFNRKTNYIPLIIKLEPLPQKVTNYEALMDARKALEEQVYQYERMKDMQSDFIIALESNFLECLLPSLFGAELFVSPGGFLDCKAIFSDVEQLRDIKMPDLNGGFMPHAIKHLTYLRDNVPDWMIAQISRMISPLDTAIVLRGGDFFLDLIDEPEIVANFLDIITDTTIAVVKILKDIINEPYNEQITVRGAYYPGLRLTNDSIVNFSPEMIEEFYFPCLKKMHAEFGKLMLHYCCTPAPSGHVIEALLRCDYVDAIDNWQGYETFFRNDEIVVQDKISICTDLPYEAVDNFDEYIKDKPFFKDVMRKNGRALTITTKVKTVQEGNALYQKWQKNFNIV